MRNKQTKKLQNCCMRQNNKIFSSVQFSHSLILKDPDAGKD